MKNYFVCTDYDNEHSVMTPHNDSNSAMMLDFLQKTCFPFQEIDIVCLEPIVLQVNMAYWANIFAQDPRHDRAAMQHAAYRQFVLWWHVRLGVNIRCVVPSCVVCQWGVQFVCR